MSPCITKPGTLFRSDPVERWAMMARHTDFPCRKRRHGRHNLAKTTHKPHCPKKQLWQTAGQSWKKACSAQKSSPSAVECNTGLATGIREKISENSNFGQPFINPPMSKLHVTYVEWKLIAGKFKLNTLHFLFLSKKGSIIDLSVMLRRR